MGRHYAPMACFLAVLTACGERSPSSPARPEASIAFDLPGNDQCHFYMTERPDDCDLGPCTYADAVLHLSPGDSGGLSLTARAHGGIWPGARRQFDASRIRAIRAPSPATAAAHLPETLTALGIHHPVSEICVGVKTDQDLRFGDIVAFRNALSALGFRKAAFMVEKAED